MREMDINVIKIYTRILKDRWRVDGCFRCSNGIYTVTLSKESNWPYDPPDARVMEDYPLVPR